MRVRPTILGWAGLCLLTLATACSPPPPEPEPGGAFQPFSLADGEARELTFTLDAAGEALLRVTASAPETTWGAEGRESLVMAVTVDGRVRRHLVWTSPHQPTRAVMLGRLEPGEHLVELERVSSLSRDRSGALEITAATLALAEDQELVRWAPVLLGREDTATSDLPALVLAKKSGSSFEYTVVFTNEDGGTGVVPRRLMAQWGRLLDIEWAMTVQLTSSGALERRTFQGLFHGDYEFGGVTEGDHALLNVATTNGVFSDDGALSRFKLAEPPVLLDDSEPAPRERALDAFPWTHALAEAEGVREGKVDPACQDATKVWAFDCYLFVDVAASSATSLRRVWGLEARTASGGVFRSEAGEGVDGRLDRRGQVRVAVPVPRDAQLTELRVYAVHDGGDAFTLDVGSARIRRWRNGVMETVASPDQTASVGSTVPDAVLWTP